MIAELHGKRTGCAKGKGGSMHLIDLKAGILGAVPIVGSTIPIGTGVAWGEKLKKTKNLVVIFFGDGATEQGVFQESLDFASLHNLEVLFVCENNSYSVYSHQSKRQYKDRYILKTLMFLKFIIR
jgi:pyruvate dehydrogenase E1 component alpha subunit